MHITQISLAQQQFTYNINNKGILKNNVKKKILKACDTSGPTESAIKYAENYSSVLWKHGRNWNYGSLVPYITSLAEICISASPSMYMPFLFGGMVGSCVAATNFVKSYLYHTVATDMKTELNTTDCVNINKAENFDKQ